MATLRIFVLALFCWHFVPADLGAQLVTGTISGRVADPSGAVITSATVTLVSEGTGDSRNTVTNQSGLFVFPSVPAGVYTLKVERDGFRAFQRTGIVLTAQERLAVGDIALSLGQVSETVSVTAEGAIVSTESSDNSALLTSRQLELTAVRGRDVISLLRLLPGVAYQVNTETVGQGFGTGLPNVQGTRNTWSSITVDGLAGNDLGSPNVFSSSINLDAIGEVKVLLNNYDSEYGRNGGSFVNIITKSGTRSYHGSGYWYKRHEMFNANDFFNNLNRQPKPLHRYTTLGATVGGPAVIPGLIHGTQEKLFFFYSVEYWQTKNPQGLRQYTMPSELERGGNFSQTLDPGGQIVRINDPLTRQQFPGDIIPPGRINRNGQALLNRFPVPNFFDRAISRGNYNFRFQESTRVPKNQHVLRLDYRPSARDSFSARGSTWFADNQGFAVPAGSSNWGLVGQHYTFTDNGFVLSHVHVFSPRVVNEVSGGLRHSVEKGPPLSGEQLDRVLRPKAGFNIGQLFPEFNPLNVLPRANFGGVPSAPAISYDGRFPLRGADTLIDASDTLSIQKGSHAIKAGVFLERVRNYEGAWSTFGGEFNFGRDVNNPFDSNYAFSNALLGNFQQYTESSSRPSTEGRQTIVDWFVQDSWKATRRLTLNYGLRFVWYNHWSQRTGRGAAFALERYDRARAPLLFQPAIVDGRRVALNPITRETQPAVVIGAFVPGTGDPVNGMVVATDKNYPKGFMEQRPITPEPRLGFAWDVFGNGKTAVRGGFGVFHNTLAPGGSFRQIIFNPPVQFNPVIFYGNLDTFLNSTGVLFPSNVDAWDRKSVTPGLYNFTLGIQRDLGFGTVLSAAYVGSLGRHLQQSRNLNLVPYGARFLAENIDPTTRTPLNENFFRPFPGHGSVGYREHASTSNYHALQVQVNRRFIRGLQFAVAYTWSKTMDFTDTDGGGVAVYRPIRVWNYGKAGFDQTHILVLNYTWDLPRMTRIWNNGFARWVFDNWQVSGITAFVSGFPSGVGFSTVEATDITGGGDGARIIVTGKAQLPRGERTFDRWFNPTVFARPARGDFGNAPKDVFRRPGINSWDISLFKNFPVGGEQRYFQLRWEMYNAFNHTQFDGVDSTARFDAAGNQVNARFGEVTSTRLPRIMQASLRFTF